MAEIVAMAGHRATRQHRPKAGRPAAGSAQLLFFTGVRRERIQAQKTDRDEEAGSRPRPAKRRSR